MRSRWDLGFENLLFSFNHPGDEYLRDLEKVKGSDLLGSKDTVLKQFQADSVDLNIKLVERPVT